MKKNRPITLLNIVGVRPQFIKAAAISRAIMKLNASEQVRPIKEVLVHTGQHYDTKMVDVFFSQFEMKKPDYNLNVGSKNHVTMISEIMEKTKNIILKTSPDIILVYGDTNSTLAATLSAKKMDIPIAHIESGLRSYDKSMPEEINRILVDQVSNFLFCPSRYALQNLKKENLINSSDIYAHIPGDVMYDTFLWSHQKIHQKNYSTSYPLNRPYVLFTLHRQSNTDCIYTLSNIFRAINIIGKEIPVILPLHPRLKSKIKSLDTQNIEIIDPLSYFDMILMLKHCSLVITDSGGLQKESYFSQKNCLVLRENTEWIELVDYNYSYLVKPNTNEILTSYSDIKSRENIIKTNIYGDGNAAENIIQFIDSHL